jgi:drug/metabolite transporter (DMT)-like permease
MARLTGRGESMSARWRETAKLVAAFAAVYVVWGSTYFAIKVVVTTMPPLSAAGSRFIIAGVAVYAWARWRGAPRPDRSYWPGLALLGALMFVPGYSAIFLAERIIPSGMAAVLVATLPLWMLLFETAVLKKRTVTAPLITALACGFVGVVLVTGVGTGGAAGAALLPSLAILGSTGTWAMGSVLTKRLRLPSSSAITAGVEMAWGGLLLLALGGAVGEWRALNSPSPGAWYAFAYLIVAGSIIAYSAYVWLLGRTSPTRLASYSYVNPIIALVVGFVLGGERLPLHALLGTVLVLASVVIVLTVGAGGGAGGPKPAAFKAEQAREHRGPTASVDNPPVAIQSANDLTTARRVG